MTDYIKRSDASRAMAKYLMDTALIDNPEASDHIEEWEGNISAPVMSTVKAADVVAVVRCKDCKHNHCELVAGEECWLCGLGHEGHKIDRQDFYCADGER